VGATLAAQSVQSTLLALKDSSASQSALSNQLADQMIAMAAKESYSPSRITVQRFSESFTSALLGKEVTAERAKGFQMAFLCVLNRQGSTFVAAKTLGGALTSCGVEEHRIKAIVDRFSDIGREIRGPDDLSRTLVRLP
jgi:hypothetical protein